MLKFVSYDIVFQEIPDEVTLAVNISGCPNGCPGCHSPYLWRDEGRLLVPEEVEALLEQYGGSVTCLCFMGGDGAPGEVAALARWLREAYPGLRTAWYSGRSRLPEEVDAGLFDYLKLGPYVERCGGLRSRTTNQRLYRIRGERGGVCMEDITARFWCRIPSGLPFGGRQSGLRTVLFYEDRETVFCGGRKRKGKKHGPELVQL